MARPTKENADYFSHDNNMRNDPKIKALRRKFSIGGYAIWNMLLEVLTDAENFEVKISPLQIELLAGDFDCESDLLNDLIEYSVSLGLLKRDGEAIFSESLKKRLQPVIDKRNRFRDRFLPQKQDESVVSATETTQNKSKVNKTKINKSNTDSIDKVIVGVNASQTPEIEENSSLEDFEEKEKSSAKKEKENPGLKLAVDSFKKTNCKFSDEFLNLWKVLGQMPKWKKKPISAFELAINKLMKFEEGFALMLLESAISGNYQGIVFQNTDQEYQDYLRKKTLAVSHNGINNNYTKRGASSAIGADEKREGRNAFAGIAKSVLLSSKDQFGT